MNTKEYIASGIVESYVLGLASEEERREFEAMCLQYPEVLEARISFELALEKQAMENAIAPPAAVRNNVLQHFHPTPVRSLPVIPSSANRNNNWLRYAAAACVILLAGSIYYSISLRTANQQLEAKNRVLQSGFDSATAKLNEMHTDMSILKGNPNIKMASMKGTDMSPQSYATVYWDTTSHDVYLMTNNLPVPASDKQYQLWAIFNGKPVDLGVFDIKKERLLIKATNAQGAEAFAITLEKEGGSPIPKGDMYVVGKL